MPILDGELICGVLCRGTHFLIGVGATVEIRQIERARSSHQSVIVALTGMSSLEDKRKAFEAGMNG